MEQERKKEICRYIDAHSAIFTGLSDYIWEHPELSLKEFSSCAAYA